MPDHTSMPEMYLEHSFAEQLPGFYVPCQPAAAPRPELLQLNESLAEELGLAPSLDAVTAAKLFSGGRLPDTAQPIAQAYAGHQFGSFVPQLGDGRALLIGEVVDHQGHRRDIAFKGSGPTPFSRGGDGKAAVGPVLREYVIGEAMHALGIPTTRALAAVGTGERVFREQSLPGAILTRRPLPPTRLSTLVLNARLRQRLYVLQLAFTLSPALLVLLRFSRLVLPHSWRVVPWLRQVVCSRSLTTFSQSWRARFFATSASCRTFSRRCP